MRYASGAERPVHDGGTPIRIALIGQRDFGKAVLEAFLARGDEVAAVFCAPEKEGTPPDALSAAARERGLVVHQLRSLRGPEAAQAMRESAAEIGIMAFVTQFAPAELVAIPRHGTIQYHPSLLPRYRGPSAINWAIVKGETETGLTIFRPTEGLDEGPVILQRRAPIGPDDTLGTVYFERLFPLGVEALLEAADQVVAGRHAETEQDETQASYEGWCRDPEAQVNWHSHVDFIHNLIRGCDPAPGAWTTYNGQKLRLFGSRRHPFRTYGAVKGKVGEIVEARGGSLVITAQGGQIEVTRARLGDGRKLAASEVGLEVGTLLPT
jgi:methionyl-tRNA formyltransferase